MNRLVGLWMIAWALVGCSQGREGLRPTDGLAPAAMPTALAPIGERINEGPSGGPPMIGARAPGVTPRGAPAGGGAPSAVAAAPRLASSRVEPRLPPEPSTADPSGMPSEAMPVSIATATLPPPGADPLVARGHASPGGESDAPVDSAVVRASATSPETAIGEPIGEWAARVDGDIITWNELQSAVARRFRELDPKVQSAPGVRESLAANVLDHLIDRSLVIQKARRNELKDAKRWELINRAAADFFERERLPGLLRQYKAEDRYALERVLSERGESLEELVDSFKLEFIYQQFLMMNVASKIRVDLPEMRAYYFENKDHEAFQQGPQLTWREILVRFANHPTREAAQEKMDAAMARLTRGEPFQEVARTMGEGPNADNGGLWTTAPGTYAVATVNAALGTLSPGQTSGVVEGPNGLHLVRLEENRPAGRKRFEEVQDEIRDILKARKEAELIENYLTNLYRGAVVTTVFKEYVPRHLRDSGAGG